MKLEFDDITDRHKKEPCVVALHGPSLDFHREKIESLQKEKKLIRLSVNEWYDFFSVKPDYWIVSNGEFTIDASINGSHIWTQRQYPHDVFNKYDIPLIYNSTADLTSDEVIDSGLRCDYLPYDARHFNGHACMQIIKNFKEHYEKNKNLDFKFYGNNSNMWNQPNVTGFEDWMKKLHGRIGGGWNIQEKCCHKAGSITLQEKLQEISKYSQYAGPGHTVGLHAIMLAIIMGCNPIYVSGLDLDCSLGYAEGANDRASYNSGHMGHWKKIFSDFLLDDMRIIKESAEMLGIEIINLNKNSWHNVFLKGNLEL